MNQEPAVNAPRSPLLIDYHLHTAVTIDGKMHEAEACEQALARGIHEIAFTNHLMLNQPDYCMSRPACQAHWEQIQACQKRHPDLIIRLGIEVDYYPGREQEIGATVRDYEELLGRPFDVVLGSVHELDDVFFSNQRLAPALYKGRDPVSLYREYFLVAAQAVRSGLFDVMAHPDLIKKYAYELIPPPAFAEYRAAVERYIQALLDTGVGMELNTKGLKLKVNEAYPSKDMLEVYLSSARAAGTDPILTLGSDAHKAEEVGDHLQEGRAILRELGVQEISRFEGHIRSAREL